MGEKVGKDDNKVEGEGVENLSTNIDEYKFTVTEVANFVDESSNVIRNWMRELKNHIPLKKNENGYNMFSEESIKKINEIKELHRDQNFSIKQVNHYLNTGGESFIPEKDTKIGDKVTEEIKKMRQEMVELKKQNEKQEQFNVKLLEELQKQSDYIKTSLDKRDTLLLDTFKKSMNEKKTENKSFWKRVFNK